MKNLFKILLVLTAILSNFILIINKKKVFLLDFAPRYGGAVLFLENKFEECFYTESSNGKSSSLYLLKKLKEKGYEMNWIDPYTYFPLSVFLFIPFSFFNFKFSGILFLLLSSFLFIFSLYFLKKKEKLNISFLIFVSILLISTPFRHSFLTANPELLSVSFLIFSLYLTPLLSGVFLSLSVFLKPHSIFLILYFLLRDIKKFLYSILFLLLGFNLSFYFFGSYVMSLYFDSVIKITGTFKNYATLYNLFHYLFKENFKLLYFLFFLFLILFTLYIFYKRKTEKFIETGIFLNISLFFIPLFQLYYLLRLFPYYFIIFKGKLNILKFVFLFILVVLFLIPFKILKNLSYIYTLCFFIIYILSVIYLLRYGTESNLKTD